MSDNSDSLDFPLQEFDRLIARGKDLILARYSELDDNAYPGHTQQQVFDWFDEPLPEQGIPMDTLLDEVKAKVMDTPTMNIGPHMYAYVMAGGNQVSIIADMLASAINQNVAKWHLAPALTEIEKRVIQWASEFIHYGQDEQSNEPGGAMVSAGSAANLTGLTVARNIFFEQAGIREHGLFGQKPFTVYASDQTHNSVDKSVELLGIGNRHYRKIPVNRSFQIDLPALKGQIDKDIAAGFQPFCLIGNAGTVNTGAVDPLDALAGLAQTYKMWFHVDGCYGGLVASLPEFSTTFKGLDQADSIACDFHKWLYQPFEVGCTLVRDWSQLKRTYHTTADYLDDSQHNSAQLDINEHHFQLSRNAKAFKVWMSFKAFGSSRFKDMIRKDISLRCYLDELLTDASDFELLTQGPLAISCFRYIGSGQYSDSEVRRINKLIIPALEQDQRVFITGTKLHGEPVIRACIINHRKNKSHIEYLLNVIREVGRKIEVQL